MVRHNIKTTNNSLLSTTVKKSIGESKKICKQANTNNNPIPDKISVLNWNNLSINFDKNNIALSNELALYDDITQKIQYYYLKIDKKKAQKKVNESIKE